MLTGRPSGQRGALAAAISVSWVTAANSTLSGTATLTLTCVGAKNVEIFNGGSLVATATISGTTATASISTAQFVNGALTLTAHAWNAPAGQAFTADADAGSLPLIISNSAGTTVPFDWVIDPTKPFNTMFGNVQSGGDGSGGYLQNGDVPETGATWGLTSLIGVAPNQSANRVMKMNDPLGQQGICLRLATGPNDPTSAGGIRSDILAQNGGSFSNGRIMTVAARIMCESAALNRSFQFFDLIDVHGSATNSNWQVICFQLNSSPGHINFGIVFTDYSHFVYTSLDGIIRGSQWFDIVVTEKMDNGSGGGFINGWIWTATGGKQQFVAHTGQNATAGDNIGTAKLACYGTPPDSTGNWDFFRFGGTVQQGATVEYSEDEVHNAMIAQFGLPALQ